MKDVDNPLSRAAIKNTLTYFDNLKTMGGFGGKPISEMDLTEKKENAQLWLNVKNEFIKWVEENPEDAIDDDKVEKKRKALARIPAEEITLSWFSRLMRKKMGAQLFGLVASEEKALIGNKMEALAKEDIWSEMNEEDKQWAKKRFENGETVNSIIEKWLE